MIDLDRSASYDSLTNLMIDSLVHFINKEVIKSNTGEFYYLSRLANGFYITDWNKASLNQLINSGNLRYFSNTELVDKINIYNTISTAIASVQQIIGTRRERSFQYSDQIFIPEWLLLYTQFSTDDILDGEKKRFIDSLKNAAPSLQTNIASAINSFGNAILATKSNRQFLLQSLYPLAKRSAVEIIELIKKEYHLKDG